MDLLDRLKLLMEKTNDNNASLARNSGIPYTTIDGLFKKGYKNAYVSTMQKLSDYFNVTIDYLIKGTDGISDEALILAGKYDGLDAHGKRVVDLIVDAESDRCKEDRKRREQEKKPRIMQMPRRFSMPIYNEPAADGKPLDVGSDFEYLDFEEDTVPNGADFGVRIKGDSMGDSVPDGCIAFVRKAERAENGDIVIAWVDGEGTVCKRFIGEGDRLLYLKSDNESYPDITGDALIGLRIYGVVVGHTAQA